MAAAPPRRHPSSDTAIARPRSGENHAAKRIPSEPPIQRLPEAAPVELMRRVAAGLRTWTPPRRCAQITGTAWQRDFICAAFPHNPARIVAIAVADCRDGSGSVAVAIGAMVAGLGFEPQV